MKILLIFLLLLETVQFIHSFQHCPKNEKKALLDFKKNVIDKTNRLSSWTGDDCCVWKGVHCDNKTGHIVKLALRNPFPYSDDRLIESDDVNDLMYEEACLVVLEINPSLVELKYLSYLDLSWNNFAGIQIPDFFGSFSKLKYLNLSYSCFGKSIPHHLGNLSSLRFLDLSNPVIYNFGLNVPTLNVDDLHWTSNLYWLQYLDLSGINLSHIHTDSFASLPANLLDLRLSQCSLSTITLSAPKNLTSLLILDLSFNDLHGPIPNCIWNMTFLTAIDLSNNGFTSTFQFIVDRLKNLNNLELFDMYVPLLDIVSSIPQKDSISENYFRGPLPSPSPKTFTNLRVLRVGGNMLTGSLPDSLGNFSALEILDVSYNQLSGNIPKSLAKLSSLETLKLHYNQLSGYVPKSLGQLSQLSLLFLSSNSLTGNISEDVFSHLSKLESLDLSKNFLTFNITPAWRPPFQLQWVRLDYCIVGPHFPNWLRHQNQIYYLNMSYGGISSSLPDWFRDITGQMHALDLSHNEIHGEIPTLLTQTDYGGVVMYLGFNRFSGKLPSFPLNVSILDLSHNQLSGPILKNFDQLYPKFLYLDLSNNHLNGSIPSSLCRMVNLNDIVLSKNHLSGSLPGCWNSSRLNVMDLSFNNLSGVIPSSFGKLHLVSLHLRNNNLHGEIPSSFQNFRRLSILDLGNNDFSGQIPAWIGESLSTLQVLSLRSNKFNGSLSPNLCHLYRLHIFDVSQNNLSGNIPSCFGNFTVMASNATVSLDGNTDDGIYFDSLAQVIKGREREYVKILRFLYNIDLSSNNFVGHIPSDLTSLSGLIALNLSNNHLTGSIPKNIGRMISLESLDFSRNHLSGKIPQSISSLSLLSHLNLSYNHLSGQIPTGNQLQTLDDPSIYKGNTQLCGPPLARKCSGDEPVDDREEEETNEYSTKWFWSGMAAGFAVGFWCVWGPLTLNRTWWYAYFQYLDDIIGKLFVATVTSIAQVKRKFKSNDVQN